MDINAMKFLSKRLSLLIAALLAFTMAASVVPAAAQEISPEHLALARKYVDLTDKANIYEAALIKTAIDTMSTITNQNPELVEQTNTAIEKTLAEYKDRKGDLMDQFARVYALNFSMEEMTQIVAFYDSPVGQKLTNANASLNEGMQTIMGIFEANLKREFFAKVRAELKAAGFDT
jgi:uncharacterized protein